MIKKNIFELCIKKQQAIKLKINRLFKNELFFLFFNATLGYIAFTAVILATLEVPSDAILDSGLKEILMIFEGF